MATYCAGVDRDGYLVLTEYVGQSCTTVEIIDSATYSDIQALLNQPTAQPVTIAEFQQMMPWMAVTLLLAWGFNIMWKRIYFSR